MANKYDQMMRYRTDGMEYALRIAKDKGIKALEAEVRFRNKTGVSIPVTKEELNAASQKIKDITLDTFTILSLTVLHDEFGFGNKRSQQFLNRMYQKAEGIADDFCTWKDYIDVLKTEIGIDVEIRWNN